MQTKKLSLRTAFLFYNDYLLEFLKKMALNRAKTTIPVGAKSLPLPPKIKPLGIIPAFGKMTEIAHAIVQAANKIAMIKCLKFHICRSLL